MIIGSGKDGLPVILGNVDTPIAPQAPALGAPPADNSEAAKDKPAGLSPPLLEKTPASNLPGPAERPSPTGVPRGPADRPPGASPGGPPPGGAVPPGAPGRQAAAPPEAKGSAWTVGISKFRIS